MRTAALISIALVLVSLTAAAFYRSWGRTAPESELAAARATVGTTKGRTITEKLIKEFPDSAEVQFLRARQLTYDGKTDPAEECLNKATGLGWPRAQVERQRRITASHHDFAKTEPQLLELLDKNANDHEVALALAVGYNRNRLPNRALILLDRLVQSDPNDGAALTARGSARLQMLQADLALPDLEKACSLSEDRYYHYRVQFLLAECLRTLGKVERAIELYRKCSQETPTDIVAIYNGGVCAHYLGQSDEAMSAFQEVLRLQPNDVETLLQVAYLHDEQRDLDEALQVLRKIEAAYPDEPQMLVQMAKTYQAKGNTEEAAKYRQRFEDLKRHWEERAAKEREKGRAS